MFETYESIFSRRGEAYHRAMQLVPAARRKEFSLALERTGLAKSTPAPLRRLVKRAFVSNHLLRWLYPNTR